MNLKTLAILFACGLVALLVARTVAQEPPEIPVGLDAYRR